MPELGFVLAPVLELASVQGLQLAPERVLVAGRVAAERVEAAVAVSRRELCLAEEPEPAY